MYHLWLGIMAGLLLAYLVRRAMQWRRTARLWQAAMRRPHGRPPLQQRPRRWWSSPRWWLAVLLMLALLVPIGWDFWELTGSDFKRLDGLKHVAMPWAAGAGIGFWMFTAIAQGQHAALSRAWLPILVATILVGAIVSDERYNWFGRLQKVTFGGSGIELSPLSAGASANSRTPVDNSPNEFGVNPKTTGAGRIGNLIDYMQDLPDLINRDRDYMRETGLKFDDNAFANEYRNRSNNHPADGLVVRSHSHSARLRRYRIFKRSTIGRRFSCPDTTLRVPYAN